MSFKSVLTPEGSVVAGIATAGLVWGVYNGSLGNVASIHLTDANSGAAESSRKKAGYTALAVVAGVSLLARDPNIAILGGASIIALELQYRHAIMVDSESGQIVTPGPQSYQPAELTTPVSAQGTYTSVG